MNIAVGARAGVIDDLFVGNFIGMDVSFRFITVLSFFYCRLCFQFCRCFPEFSLFCSGQCVWLSPEGHEIVRASSSRLFHCFCFHGNFIRVTSFCIGLFCICGFFFVFHYCSAESIFPNSAISADLVLLILKFLNSCTWNQDEPHCTFRVEMWIVHFE